MDNTTEIVDLSGFELRQTDGKVFGTIDSTNPDGTYTITEGFGANAQTKKVSEEELYKTIETGGYDVYGEDYGSLKKVAATRGFQGGLTKESIVESVKEQEKINAAEGYELDTRIQTRASTVGTKTSTPATATKTATSATKAEALDTVVEIPSGKNQQQRPYTPTPAEVEQQGNAKKTVTMNDILSADDDEVFVLFKSGGGEVVKYKASEIKKDSEVKTVVKASLESGAYKAAPLATGGGSTSLETALDKPTKLTPKVTLPGANSLETAIDSSSEIKPKTSPKTILSGGNSVLTAMDPNSPHLKPEDESLSTAEPTKTAKSRQEQIYDDIKSLAFGEVYYADPDAEFIIYKKDGGAPIKFKMSDLENDTEYNKKWLEIYDSMMDGEYKVVPVAPRSGSASLETAMDPNSPHLKPDDPDLKGINEEPVAQNPYFTAEEQEQLEQYIKAYMDANNVTELEARTICTKELQEQKEAEKNTNEDNNYSPDKNTRMKGALEKKEYLDSTLKGVKNILKGNNKQKATKLKDSLVRLASNSPLLTSTVNFQGESSKEYQLYIEDLKERLNIVIDNANIAETASKIIDEELIPTLEAIEENDIKREELRTQLEEKKKEYDTHVSNKPPKYVPMTYIDKSVVPNETKTIQVTNTKYTAWLKNKKTLEDELEELVKVVEECDKIGTELSEKCYMILGKETDLEALIKQFAGSNNTKNPGDSGGDNSKKPKTNKPKNTPDTEAPTEPEPPADLPDNTQEQMNYYKELSMDELADISANLQSFATENEMTLEKLLNDNSNSDKLINHILESPSFSTELKELIKNGDKTATQEKLRSILQGQENEALGINSFTKDTLKLRLTNVASANNMTLEDLINKKENHSLLKVTLGEYGDVINKFKNQSNENIKSQLTKFYDGDGVSDIPESTLDIVKNFTDIASSKSNKDIDSYLESDDIVNDFKHLGKTSVFINNLSTYDSDKLIENLNVLLK